ncbi:MAG: asparagine synthase-related protein [Candidatus Bathyarchaeia archaeon]|jgi:asparagine synthase (glutamine-hydrolysing)
MKTTLAVLDKTGKNVAPTVAEALKNVYSEAKTFTLATPHEVATGKEAVQGINSSVAIGAASTSNKPEKQMRKLKDATLAFEGRTYAPNTKEALEKYFPEKTQMGIGTATEAFLREAEGDFSILIAQTGKLLAARDPVGVEPLYFGETEQVAALASNRKTLWKLGIQKPQSFPPGHLGTVTPEGFVFKPVQTLAFAEPKPITMHQAAEELQRLLEDSVCMRVLGQKSVAVAFSGGLDSSLVACLAKRCVEEVQLVHVSLVDQPETEEAKKAAAELGLPLQVHLFTEAELEEVIPKVVGLIEEPDPIKASVGVPFYWNAQKASKSGFGVMLAGQGADELFGGYQRYVTQYLQQGNQQVRQTMFHDVAVIHESNIERDEKICRAHEVELRLPFASMQVAAFAMRLPTELKFEHKADTLRKLVLRKTAENRGLPKSIVEKPKKAVQYSTGISNALKRLAKKQNQTLAEYINKLFLETKN